MSKKSLSNSLSSWRMRLSGFNGLLLIASSVLILAGGVMPSIRNIALADQYDNQISALQNQNAAVQNTLNGLVAGAQNYQQAIAALQGQINALQASINSNLAQQAQIQQKITDLQHKIDERRQTLASDVKSMYVDGTPTTLEMLATSKNLSDFVDKQEYRYAVQNKLQDVLQEISTLQGQLKSKKNDLNLLLSNLNTQKSQLAGEEAQQASLLAYNQSQQASYNAQLAANNAQISNLRAQQAAAIAALTGSGGSSATNSPVRYKNMSRAQECGGGYEYCYNADGSYTWLDEFVNDPWGFYSARECAHYVVDALHVRGYYVGGPWPGGSGYADAWWRPNGWPIQHLGAHLDSYPQVNDVVFIPIPNAAIDPYTGQPVGHVAIVDSVNGDGTVTVSQYNWYPGMYSTMDLYLSTSGLRFIHFRHVT